MHSLPGTVLVGSSQLIGGHSTPVSLATLSANSMQLSLCLHPNRTVLTLPYLLSVSSCLSLSPIFQSGSPFILERGRFIYRGAGPPSNLHSSLLIIHIKWRLYITLKKSGRQEDAGEPTQFFSSRVALEYCC